MVAVQVLADNELSADLLERLHRMVVRAFDGDFAEEDWQHTYGGWRVVACDGEVPVAHAAVVPRELRVGDRPLRTGYVEGVATEPHRQRAGLGSLVMAETTHLVRREFEMGALSTGVPDFYRRFGWERWQGPTHVRDGEHTRRTPEEDDGVLVLRFGPSADADLTAPISCDARVGDDW